MPRRFFFRKLRFAGPSVLSLSALYLFASTTWGQGSSPSAAKNPFQQIGLYNKIIIETKAYLDQAWEQKIRPGLTANSGLVWDSSAREWKLKAPLPDEAQKAIAHYASWTATPTGVGINIAEAHGETDKLDELAKFYNAFLKAYFTTVGELQMIKTPGIKLKLLGPESGWESARTLPWYWKQPDNSVILRECNQCNAEYFLPAARLIRAIATLQPKDRTTAMNQFVAAYVPLLAKEHIIRLNFVERMKEDMTPDNPYFKRRVMIADEIFDIASAAQLLGAYASDSKFVVLGEDDLSKLKELVRVGVDRFQFSQTLTKDASGRICASYFNGDYDQHEDMDYARYEGEAFPTPGQKAKPQGVSWDISHFSLIPMFLWSLFENRHATGVDFPQRADLEHIGNQYAYHVFEGDYQKPLFSNFFDGSDGWYRVSYQGRANYGIAPSRYCNMSDPSRGCITIAGIYSWGLLASTDPDIARVQTALIDLARSSDPSIACFQSRCFRERYYRYADTSFSFLDPDGKVQYPPALVVVLSELALSFSQ